MGLATINCNERRCRYIYAKHLFEWW